MARTFREQLAEEAPTWAAEGLVSEEQAARIVARYAHEGARQDHGSHGVAGALYGAAAVLLGAAAIAFIIVGLDPPDASLPLFFAGLALAGVGAVLYAVLPERRILADTVLVAALAPLATSTIDHDLAVVPVVAGLAAVALLVWRFERSFVPPLALLAAAGAAAGGSFFGIDEGDTATTVWMACGLALAAGTAALQRLRAGEPRPLPTAMATLVFAITLIPFLFEATALDDSVAVELVLGLVLLVALGAGLGLKDQGVVIGATTALGIDAIVFAFDVGGVVLGVGVLLALAAVLVWQAERLRHYLAA